MMIIVILLCFLSGGPRDDPLESGLDRATILYPNASNVHACYGAAANQGYTSSLVASISNISSSDDPLHVADSAGRSSQSWQFLRTGPQTNSPVTAIEALDNQLTLESLSMVHLFDNNAFPESAPDQQTTSSALEYQLKSNAPTPRGCLIAQSNFLNPFVQIMILSFSAYLGFFTGNWLVAHFCFTRNEGQCCCGHRS
ncbi:hypothetical protein EJ08DRAFT_104975 [Tothia fuscella]|uniref:Uncharacterized protein n=1 Tax=Tothia fuscella TaxID=1048955 RepID=A0A9P4NWJ4_9PEZI|nr:hypothetical protein EJ08DRAFT_104975 [Tothia fuscella]